MDTISSWVAVVDDEAAIRRALLRLLRAAGIAAREYAGGTDLLAELERGGGPAHGAPYCVVLDLHMPGMSGIELQERLAGLLPHTGVIAVTGQHSAETQARVLRPNLVAYMQKPMNDQSLLDALAAARAAWNGL
jgi:FixJ family two-component response regulator